MLKIGLEPSFQGISLKYGLNFKAYPESRGFRFGSAQTRSVIVPVSPLDHGLIIQAQDEVGEGLEEVLPEQQRDAEGEAAYVQLAARPGEGRRALAAEPVPQVLTAAAVEAGLGRALVDVQVTPSRHKQQRPGPAQHAGRDVNREGVPRP